MSPENAERSTFVTEPHNPAGSVRPATYGGPNAGPGSLLFHAALFH